MAWTSSLAALQRRVGIRCPVCDSLVPVFYSACRYCGTPMTIDTALKYTLEPALANGRRWAKPNPQKIRAFQWGFLLASAGVFSGLFHLLRGMNVADAILPAFLSIFYLALFFGYAVLFVPKGLIFALVFRTSGKVKLAFFLNFLSFVILLHFLVQAWWAQALLLAIIFFGIGIAFWLFWNFLLPFLATVIFVFGPQRERSFDPQQAQGRRVETE